MRPQSRASQRSASKRLGVGTDDTGTLPSHELHTLLSITSPASWRLVHASAGSAKHQPGLWRPYAQFKAGAGLSEAAAARMACRTALPLCEPRLSRMTMSPA
jgi:hypothetical protein